MHRQVRLPEWRVAFPLLLIVAGLALVTYLHYTTTAGLSRLHTVYRYFYFFPIVYAALRYGYWGGLLAALVAAAVFAPHIFFKWGNFPDDSLNDLFVVVVFFGVSIITGITVDRLRAAEARQAQTVEMLASSVHQLEEQGEELRRAERLGALGLLAGGLAHEIRNPVGIIRASAQLLNMEAGQAVAETTSVIQQETDRIENLIQNLLDYAGDIQLNRSRTDVAALLARVGERISPLTSSSDIHLEIQQSTCVPPVSMDAEQMERALINLCMNAIQAMDGSGKLILQAYMCESHDACLELRVVDSGPGIPTEERSRIFDPFYTTKDKGTGLGLSVVQRIVDEHGGRIWVESVPSAGATFVIQLPLK